MKRFLYTLLLFTICATGTHANAQTPGGILTDAELRSKPYFTDLTEALKTPNEVYRIAIDVTGLRRLPREVEKFSNLQAVAIYGDKSSLDWVLVVSDLQDMDKLKGLAIDGQGLDEIPFPIFRLVRLTSFEFNNAPITSLPDGLFKLKNLTTLVITDTELSMVPDDISKLYKLEYLYLKRNKLERLPGSMVHLTNLKTLSIDSNYITSIPSAFKTLGKLESLSVSGNKLSEEEMQSAKHNFGAKLQSSSQPVTREPAKDKGEEKPEEDTQTEEVNPDNGEPETPPIPEDENTGDDTETPQ